MALLVFNTFFDMNGVLFEGGQLIGVVDVDGDRFARWESGTSEEKTENGHLTWRE